MINFIKGCSIPNSEKLCEEYNLEESNMILANVNAEKILKIIYDFIDMQDKDSRVFLFIEVPSQLEDEKILKKSTNLENGIEVGVLESTHKDVYYMDDIPIQVFKDIIEPVKDVLVNDGMTIFGVGNHITGDEIGKYAYNEVMLHYHEDIKNYEKLFNDNGIKKNQNRISPWDLINNNNPGKSEIYIDKDGKNIYDIIDAFKESFEEFYKAEQREE